MQGTRQKRRDFRGEIGTQGLADAAGQRDALRAESDARAAPSAAIAWAAEPTMSAQSRRPGGVGEHARGEGAVISGPRRARPADEGDDVAAEIGEKVAGEGAFRPKAVVRARRGAQGVEPDMRPEPSSPSAKPRPPTMVSRPATRAIAAEPVPAITSPPSAPACAPMQAVEASFAAETRA